MRFTDRSRTETDWTCRRARYWKYEFKGIGLAPMEDAPELVFGGEMAVQVAKVKRGEAWTTENFDGESKQVAEALLIGYQTYVWPRWLRDYEVVSIEQEYPLQLTDWLTYNSRPDTVMRKKADGTLWYGPEDKTTGWIDSLIHYAQNVQLHATALAIEEHLPNNEKIQGCLVQGLYKGFTKEGKLFHPLVYAYCKEGRHGIVPDQWSAKWTRGAGWERAPVSSFPGGVKGWIGKIGEGELGGVFPVSPPVMINRALAQAYLRQVQFREQEIADWHEFKDPETKVGELDPTFPQSFSQCNEWGKSRKPCSCLSLCYNPTVQKYPMSTYKYRVPHHPNEHNQEPS